MNVLGSRYAEVRNNEFNGNPVPANALRLTSGYRNPERNERIGGSRGSRHMLGRAIDLAFAGTLGQPSDERGLLFGSLWAEVEAGAGVAAAADYWQLEEGTTPILKRGQPVLDENRDGIPDIARDAGHLHIQDNP